MCLHLESVKLDDEIFVCIKISGPVQCEFYTFSPVWSTWSGPKNIHNQQWNIIIPINAQYIYLILG